MNSKRLKAFTTKCGADVLGIADLALLEGIQTESADLLRNYKRVISIGVRLADGVVDPIIDEPTPLYQQHYLKVNERLDDIALRVSQYLQKAEGKALTIPASQLPFIESPICGVCIRACPWGQKKPREVRQEQSFPDMCYR